jgi:hypothetical protein
MRQNVDSVPVDLRIAKIAAAQHGVVELAQLRVSASASARSATVSTRDGCTGATAASSQSATRASRVRATCSRRCSRSATARR